MYKSTTVDVIVICCIEYNLVVVVVISLLLFIHRVHVLKFYPCNIFVFITQGFIILAGWINIQKTRSM